MKSRLVFNKEVSLAIKEGRPLVALESTIISHGMPYPTNLETAVAVEDMVRQQGSVPATIAVMDGYCHVGLDKEALEKLALSKNVWKVSLRDLPFVVSQRLMGATTVAATMRIAAAAGIRVFATGGIGGVHRGAETSFDISADLTEMGETSVAIVSAGVKSILDIGLTLEYLETLGVPVITMGQNEFPGFYSQKSDHLSPLRLDAPEDIAALMKTKWEMGLPGSVLVALPVPKEKEVLAEEMETKINAALREAFEKGIKGKELTPFLLRYISLHTNGESLETNVVLIKNNASMAGQIAKAYHVN